MAEEAPKDVLHESLTMKMCGLRTISAFEEERQDVHV